MKKFLLILLIFILIAVVAAQAPGDLNLDGYVNVYDLVIVGSHFGMDGSQAGWDIRADTDGSGKVDIYDLVEVTKNFGEELRDPLEILEEELEQAWENPDDLENELAG